MESFQLTEFNGGLNESFAPSDFKTGQWSRLRGFVIESAKHVRSQWRIREVSASPTYTPSGYPGLPGSGVQQIFPLSGQFGDYIVALVLLGDLYSGSLKHEVRYYKVGNLHGTSAGAVWPMVDLAREDMYDWSSRTPTGDAGWVADHNSARSQSPDGSLSPTLLTPTVVNGSGTPTGAQLTIPYRSYSGATLVYGYDPRFVATIPYYGGNTGARKNAILLSCGHTVEGQVTSPSPFSYVIYEENDGNLYARSYANSYPSASSDTDTNSDGVLDNGGSLTVASDVIPKANVGVWWRGQLILGDVEYFSDPVAVQKAHSEAYVLYVAAYKEWLTAKDLYKDANPGGTWNMNPPTALGTIQLDRGIAYINNYKTWIAAWRAWFSTNKANNSIATYPTAAPTATTDSSNVRRYRNGIWFSQPGTFDQFHPFAFTGDVCPSDGQIVGFMPVQDGLLVITSSEGPEAVTLLRGTSFGFISDDAANINVRIETVKSSIGSKPILRTETPPRVSYWPVTGAVVYIGKDSGVYATNGEDMLKLDNFREKEPQEDKYRDTPITSFPNQTTSSTTENSAVRAYPGTNVHSLELNGRLPVNDEVFCTGNHIFLSRNQRWYLMTRLESGENVWSELVFPVFYDYQPFAPKHMCELNGNVYFIGELGTVWRMESGESENQLYANRRGTISYNLPEYPATYDAGIADYSAGNLPVGWAKTETPTLSVSTPTLAADDMVTKSFWHRVAVRVRRPIANLDLQSSFVSRLKRVVTSDKPAVTLDLGSDWMSDGAAVQYPTVKDQDIFDRTEVVVPAHGPSLEFSATVEFEGDVVIEGIAVYKHGRNPRRK